MRADDDEKIKPTADTVIVLWMAEAWRTPRRSIQALYAYEKGWLPTRSCQRFRRSTPRGQHQAFARPGEHSRVMDRAALIRSYTAGDLGFILHSRHQYQWHTGYAPPQTVAAPHIGASSRGRLAFESRDTGVHRHRPAFRPGRSEELKPFTRPVSRQRVRPFLIANPSQRPRAYARPRHEPGPLRKPRSLLPQAGEEQSAWRIRQ